MKYTKKQLEELSYPELKEIASQNNIILKRNKIDLIYNILKNVCSKIGKYQKKNQIGNKGRDGTTYLVNYKDEEYAMKTFRRNKSSKKIEEEAILQKIASRLNISPKVLDINTSLKYIVMEKLDEHLMDYIKENKTVTLKQQKRIISIYKKLDKAKIFHADPNLLNYMYKNKKLYIIDFGMSKKIDKKLIKKLGTNKPNLYIMTLGLVLSLKNMNLPQESYSYLVENLTDAQRLQFNL